jgi:hypothetical protein
MLWIRARIPHRSEKRDPDPHLSQKQDPHPLQNSEAVQAQNGTSGGSVDQWSQVRITFMRSRIWIRIELKSRIRIDIKVTRIRNYGQGTH